MFKTSNSWFLGGPISRREHHRIVSPFFLKTWTWWLEGWGEHLPKDTMDWCSCCQMWTLNAKKNMPPLFFGSEELKKQTSNCKKSGKHVRKKQISSSLCSETAGFYNETFPPCHTHQKNSQLWGDSWGIGLYRTSWAPYFKGRKSNGFAWGQKTYGPRGFLLTAWDPGLILWQ